MGFVGVSKLSIRGIQSYLAPRIAVGLEVAHLSHHRPKTALALVYGMGQPARHALGLLHITREALYANNIPSLEDLLHGYLITSTRCYAKLVSINVAPAFLVPGMVGAFTHKDIIRLGGNNWMGPIFLNEVVYVPVGKKVNHVGQVLGILVDISQEIAKKGSTCSGGRIRGP